MTLDDHDAVADHLDQVRAGDPTAFSGLFALVYESLRDVARRRRRRWQGDETLNTTALIHEVYLRLAEQSSPQWQSRAHFLAVASKAMRQILLDYAKRKRAAKRGGARTRISLREIEASLKTGGEPAAVEPDAVVALDASLRRLARHDPRQSLIVECRFFGGMTTEETAEALGISPATVKRGWSMAQAWLYRDLARALGDSP